MSTKKLKRFQSRVKRMHALTVLHSGRPGVPPATQAMLRELAQQLLTLSQQVEDASTQSGDGSIDAKTRKSLIAAGVELFKRTLGL